MTLFHNHLKDLKMLNENLNFWNFNLNKINSVIKEWSRTMVLGKISSLTRTIFRSLVINSLGHKRDRNALHLVLSTNIRKEKLFKIVWILWQTINKFYHGFTAYKRLNESFKDFKSVFDARGTRKMVKKSNHQIPI